MACGLAGADTVDQRIPHRIWRGCVESIPKGQWEAGETLALNYIEQMRYIILPQALRIAVAPTVGFSVQVIKGTALASIIGFVDLTKAGTMLNNATFRPFLVYSLVALIYFALCFPLSWSAKKWKAPQCRSLAFPMSARVSGRRSSQGRLQIGRGVVAIIGRSGSGKSTLLRCINGLETYDAGSIWSTASMSAARHNLRDLRRDVGIVFQQFNLFPHLTAARERHARAAGG